ncbi:MAG: ribosome silencing factor [Azorhizobium sp. 39-67-5]|nr:MAG: ribosome silencing factor [Azorhizobium sp. 39-67-5]
MCDTCGCVATEKDAATVEVIGRLLAANDHVAGHNRDHFDSHGVVAFNLMSSPGSGKTALLEATIEALKAAGVKQVRVEGQPACDWVLIDASDVIVHVFQPEVRSFYNIEKMWSGTARV